MTRNEIEHMWKVASNNPNHDTNWHDPVVEAFAKLVAQHEREACALIVETPISGEQDDITMEAKDRVAKAIRARGQA
jgi:hypothetical protein